MLFIFFDLNDVCPTVDLPTLLSILMIDCSNVFIYNPLNENSLNIKINIRGVVTGFSTLYLEVDNIQQEKMQVTSEGGKYV